MVILIDKKSCKTFALTEKNAIVYPQTIALLRDCLFHGRGKRYCRLESGIRVLL